MLYVIIIICIGAIVFLSIKLSKKQILDQSELMELEGQVHMTAEKLVALNDAIDEQKLNLKEVQDRKVQTLNELYTAQNQYRELVTTKTEELNSIFQSKAEAQDKQLNELWEAKKSNLDLQFENLTESYKQQEENVKTAFEEATLEMSNKLQQLDYDVDFATRRYQGILGPLKQLEQEKQAKLFYTIQIPEEYHEDIEFLLTTVAEKVQHPDIISKLVWAEYIKPNLDETFKRVEIEAKPGIYKLTNIDSGKAYIGKSTDIKKRIADHFKSTVGIKSIADQYVHHEMLKTGLWNWSIECVAYCDKEELNELEKYYINFFKTQEFGYNRKEGG